MNGFRSFVYLKGDCTWHLHHCMYFLLYTRSGSWNFKTTSAFIGYQKDTPASIVFQASNLLTSAIKAVMEGIADNERERKRVIKWCNIKPGSWNTEEVENHCGVWTEAVG